MGGEARLGSLLDIEIDGGGDSEAAAFDSVEAVFFGQESLDVEGEVGSFDGDGVGGVYDLFFSGLIGPFL